MSLSYAELIGRRRALALPGYATYAEAGLEGDWISPYQIASCAFDGPVLVTYNYLDAPTAMAHRDALRQTGYLPDMMFNRVLDRALGLSGLTRGDLYVTHAFHLLPPARSALVSSQAIDISFDTIGRHEAQGRDVIALGAAAARACARHGIAHIPVTHLSARGSSHHAKAQELADALERFRKR